MSWWTRLWQDNKSINPTAQTNITKIKLKLGNVGKGISCSFKHLFSFVAY